MEVGDLNVIDQVGNASNGLRYLDSSFSAGMSQAAALANAQATYSNARLATQSEWDDLFQASSLVYDGSLTLGDVFEVGGSEVISSGANYNNELVTKLGATGLGSLALWSDPDSDSLLTSTRDVAVFQSSVQIVQSSAPAPLNGRAWLIVSEAAAIPEPSSLTLLCLLACSPFVRRSRKR